jgi:RNA polymerase sigma-70 factor (ECF subfamily)
LLLTVDKLRDGEVHTPEQIASFILSTARWTLRTERRDKRRFESTDQRADWQGDDPSGSGGRGWADPEPLIERTWIRGCLESLAERDRTVVVLSFFQGSTAQEIADALGLSPGNVRVIRHRALGLLRHCLEAGSERDALGRGEQIG